MASVNGVSSSNANSIYGNRNVISGLASGMDTESMIENAISGIRTKISSIQQKQTKLTWQQEAYRSITDKMVQFSRKYTSYTSATNLLSASFFNKAVITATNGANKDKISATGKTTSDIKITSVDQLATASRYQVTGGGVLGSVKTTNSDGTGARYIQSGEALDLSKDVTTSNLEGSLTLNFSNQTFMLNFKDTENFDDLDAFKAAIEKKLADQTVSFSDGSTKKASEVISVDLNNGKIGFSDKTGGGNNVYISSATGKLNDTLGEPDFSGKDVTMIDLSGQDLTSTSTVGELISGKTMSFTLDGVTKKITLPTKDELANDTTTPGTQEDKFIKQLNAKLDSAFGAGKVKVSRDPDDATGALRFTALTDGSNLIVSSDINKTLGMKEQETTYLNTGKTLGDLLGTDPTDLSKLGDLEGKELKSPVDELTRMNDGTYRDKQGNVCDADGNWVDADGKKLYGFELKINDVVIGTYTRDTALETVMLDINNNIEAGVDVTYSKTTNQFVFASKETGAGRGIKIGDGDGTEKNLAEKIFGTYDSTKVEAGQDAKVQAEINGASLTLVRSSNNFDIDGLSITLKDTFAQTTTDPVTFTTTSDADKIVDAIKGMVEDYNAMVKEIREAFNTVPAQKANKTRYEPLTEDDKADMTETAIKNYEEKAKQGILFADSDLSSLYSKLTSAISPSGADGAALRKIGISTDYSQGLTTLSIDETALRDALTTNPDSVRAAFTKVAGEGSNTNGLMQNLKKHLDTYSSPEGTKGVLINKAGSKYSATSLLDNSIKKQIETYEKQVDKWQDKLSDKVDYYTRQFSRLEQLIAQMNSQGSSIMQMMGGG